MVDVTKDMHLYGKAVWRWPCSLYPPHWRWKTYSVPPEVQNWSICLVLNKHTTVKFYFGFINLIWSCILRWSCVVNDRIQCLEYLKRLDKCNSRHVNSVTNYIMVLFLIWFYSKTAYLMLNAAVSEIFLHAFIYLK